jgi:3'-phosphoadenosine 5'-phosphosulfate sulfotransferase (PAPS reductase)/FAD synthetase
VERVVRGWGGQMSAGILPAPGGKNGWCVTMSREDLESYAFIIVAFSGGKDSLACLLDLIERGAPRDRIELWHHDVDGRESDGFMDWPVTRDYCKRVAEALGVRIYFSWKVGGFEREMNRDQTATAPIAFETPSGVRYSGGDGGPNTRRKFPQVSADLTVRWCSSYLKIDVCAAAIRNQTRFQRARTLVVSGERAEESPARAKYKPFEPDRADLRNGRVPRHVDRWRPVHSWPEARIWEVIRRHGIVPHPAYRLGWGRVSCAACIFGSANQWASLRVVNPTQFDRIADYEVRFGTTIQRKLTVIQQADRGTMYPMGVEDMRAAVATSFNEPIVVAPEQWKLPAGAFGESCGPT